MLNNKIIFPLLVLTIILSSISFAYSQSDTIPVWIKNTAGLWYNDEINDDTFLSLIQWLIDNRIITIPNNQDDSQIVLELEKENLELMQKIELLESKETNQYKTTVQTTNNDNDKSKSYITTDKSSYSLGDTIRFSGFVNLVITGDITLTGTTVNYYGVSIRLEDAIITDRRQLDSIGCGGGWGSLEIISKTEYDDMELYCEKQGNIRHNKTLIVNKDGTFTGTIDVSDNDIIKNYRLGVRYHGGTSDNHIRSEIFRIE